MNMQAVLKQAQQMQKQMLAEKDQIDKTEFTVESSNVEVKMMGNHEVKSIKIKNMDTIEADDFEMLEDMLVVAVNEAIKKVDKATEDKMGKYTKGMPGLF